jgi:acyl-CoA thioesterase I
MRRMGWLFVLMLLAFCSPTQAQVVAFGASNVSGWNVAPTAAFPAQLQNMLQQNGYGVRVLNAGVYGSTTADMLARLDRDIPAGTKIVVLDSSGGIFNDVYKGISRQQGEADMATIEARLKARGITVIPASGAEFGPQYHQSDGAHLTPEGHRLLASQLLPQVERALGPPQAVPAQSSTQAPSTPAPSTQALPTQAPTEAVRDACMADAKRLCAAVLGNDAQRHECMHEHRAELSPDCVAAIVRSRQ